MSRRRTRACPWPTGAGAFGGRRRAAEASAAAPDTATEGGAISVAGTAIGAQIPKIDDWSSYAGRLPSAVMLVP
jgi:hypothetical protein